MEKSISAAQSDITGLRHELEETASSATTGYANLLSQLEALKTSMENELRTLETSIASLESRSSSLDTRITALKEYVDSDLKAYIDQGQTDVKAWTEATFATLEQYNATASEVSGIRAEIEALNTSFGTLETELSGKISEEISQAVDAAIENFPASGITAEQLQTTVTEIADAYTQAISAAKDELSGAFQESLSDTIGTLETSMKSWVSDQLSGYATLSYTDDRLTSLKTELENRITTASTYLENMISGLESALTQKIEANGTLIETLREDLTSLSGTVSENSAAISANATTIAENSGKINENSETITANSGKISDNAAKIAENLQSIKDNAGAIEANSSLIAENKELISQNSAMIAENSRLISENRQSIKSLNSTLAAAQEQIDANGKEIAENAVNIGENTSAIAKNSQLISDNAGAIQRNAEAIAANAASIEQLKAELETAKTEITAAYQNAIAVAIEESEGEIRGEIATEVAALNETVDMKIAQVNATIETLTGRVDDIENDIQEIKTAIYGIQTDIEEIQEQIAQIMSRIQSVTFVPQYSDGKATMTYTNSGGVLTPGEAEFDFAIRPEAAAAELEKVWAEALSVRAVYTMTRAVSFVPLQISGVSVSDDGVLSLTVSGDGVDEGFFRGEKSMNAALVISDGNNEISSDFVNVVPWTTDNIYVPDANFKAYLVREFDIDSDGEISYEEAEAVEEINISASLSRIESLAGIEYFTSLKSLDCSYNRIESLDLSNNTALTSVNASNNYLTSLDVTGCRSLVSLDCSSNDLPALDVSTLISLETLDCSDNKLAGLNVSKNTALKSLDCGSNSLNVLNLRENRQLTDLNSENNALSVLDITTCTELQTLDISGNSIGSIDFSKAAGLVSLDCSGNRLSRVDVSACSGLATMDCSGNALTGLDVAVCEDLVSLNCSHNSLTSLNVSGNTKLETLDCSGNPDLAKLWMTEAQEGSLAVTKDETTEVFHNDGGVVIPDAALKAWLIGNYDDDGDGELSIAEADNVILVNCSGRGVKDLTGLEACTNLETIDCSNNEISTIRLPRLTKLTTLRCYGNPVEILDLTDCAALQALYLQDVSTNTVSGTSITVTGYDQAASLTFSVADTPFTSLTISGSGMLSALDVTANTQLVSLDCSGNTALQSIDVSSLSVLQSLNLNSCDLQSLDVTHNTALTTLLCNDNSIPALDVRNCTALVTLECNTNVLTSLNVTYNTLLQKLDVSSNSLQAVNVRSNPALTWLNVSGNSAVNVLNVANNPALTELRASGLSISDINLSANTALTYLDLSDNAGIAQLDLSANTALITLSVENIPISDMDLSELESLQYFIADKDFYLSVEFNQSSYTIIVNDELIYFSDNNKNYFISCFTEVGDVPTLNAFWKEKGLGLTTIDELEIIYAHKSELSRVLSGTEYKNYFNSTGNFISVSFSVTSFGVNYYYGISMSDGSGTSSITSGASIGIKRI